MDIWTWPLIFVIGMIVLITLVAIQKSSKLNSLAEGRDEISEVVVEHPFKINPIIWVMGVAILFICIVIVYYATYYS